MNAETLCLVSKLSSVLFVGYVGIGIIKRGIAINKISNRMNNIISLSKPTYSSNITSRESNHQ